MSVWISGLCNSRSLAAHTLVYVVQGYGIPEWGNLSTSPGFAVGIVMTTRPFPYLRKLVPEPVGLPILFDGDITERDRRNIHLGEIGLEGAQLVTAGYQGWTMVVTGTGSTIAEAQADAYQLAQRVVIPNVRYRNDIGARLIAGDFAKVESMRLLGD